MLWRLSGSGRQRRAEVRERAVRSRKRLTRVTLEHMNQGEMIGQVEEQCRRKGWRLTPVRRRVLELVASAEGPVKAYDLLDQLKQTHPGAAPPTVYRALEFLLDHHFIHRLETINAFVSCYHPSHHHHSQFLICEECENVTELPNTDFLNGLEKAARSHDFQPRRQVVEVYGVCKRCRQDG